MTLTALKKTASGIADPKDYFLGVDPLPSRLPTSVLQFLRRDASHMDPAHGPAVHHRFVLLANMETSGYVILDGSTIPIHPGEGLLIFPFQSHHYARLSRERNASWLFTTFEYEDPKELDPLRDTSFQYEEADISRLVRLTSSLMEHWEGRRSGRSAPFELALLLSALLNRRSSYLSASGGVPDGGFPNIDFLQKVTLYIHRNLDRCMTMDEIAREAGLSSSRLRAKFKALTGISLGKYVRQTRMHKARNLLHGTSLNVTQVALSCGFDSLFSFSRAFRSATGQSPSNFRKKTRKL